MKNLNRLPKSTLIERIFNWYGGLNSTQKIVAWVTLPFAATFAGLFLFFSGAYYLAYIHPYVPIVSQIMPAQIEIKMSLGAALYETFGNIPLMLYASILGWLLVAAISFPYAVIVLGVLIFALIAQRIERNIERKKNV